MICVLVLAAGAEWESPALGAVEAHPGLVVLRRCMDVDDLMASATSGQADVALVALDAPGLDPAAVEHLRRQGVRPVAVSVDPLAGDRVRERAERLAVGAPVGAADTDALIEALLHDPEGETTNVRAEPLDPDGEGPLGEPGALGARGRVIALWGPAGAPGRTTVAVNLAAELAARGTPVLLVDADPYGGSVAQQLGILDEISGLLQMSRLATSGMLAERLGSAVRGVGPALGVVTGLPRADRWREVRPAHLERLLDLGCEHGHVVVDCGFSLEEDAADLSGRPGRNALTRTAVEMADEIVVVGAADPVGLARLARALVELGESAAAPTRVVVNRMRSSIGWSEREVSGMVEGFSRVAGLHFLPEDRGGVDRALMIGQALVDGGDSPLVHGLRSLTDALFPESVEAAAGRRRRRLGRRARA